MTVKTILTCLTSVSTADPVLSVACNLARQHGAHLVALRIIEAPTVYPLADMPIPVSIYDEFSAMQSEKTAALKTIFEKHTHAEDFVSEWRDIKSEFYTPEDCIIESAGGADIVIMAAVSRDEERSLYVKMLERVIRYCGRPVLLVPANLRNEMVGHSVLVGWNGSKQAVRAAHDVLQLLSAGDKVEIMKISDTSTNGEPDDSTKDLAAAFDRHGIDTTVVQRTWSKPGVSEVLSKEAFEIGADMIAVGAFGHSRIYDLVVGAATRNLLAHSDLPVMFSR